MRRLAGDSAALLQRMLARLVCPARPGAPAQPFATAALKPECTGCSAELQERSLPVPVSIVKQQRRTIGLDGKKLD